MNLKKLIISIFLPLIIFFLVIFAFIKYNNLEYFNEKNYIIFHKLNKSYSDKKIVETIIYSKNKILQEILFYKYSVIMDCSNDNLTILTASTFDSNFIFNENISKLPPINLFDANKGNFITLKDRLCRRTSIFSKDTLFTEIDLKHFPINKFLSCFRGQNDDEADTRTLDFFPNIRLNYSPMLVEAGLLTYSANGNLNINGIKIPVETITLGVCDDGSTACGWASYKEIRINMPLNDIKNLLLHTRSDIARDYTKENRDEESQVPFNPILVPDSFNLKKSVLFCDSGNL